MTASSTDPILVALCTGCGIGDAVPSGQLIPVAVEAVEGIRCMEHPALCSEAGRNQLVSEIEAGGIRRVAVAACSPRVKTEEFSFTGVRVERINLREQVAWMMDPGEEDTLMCAADLTRMGLARLKASGETSPYLPEQLDKAVMVLGGGISGLTAALEGAGAGYRVHLVEKGSRLGGYAGRIRRMIPSSAGEPGLAGPDVAALAARAEAHPKIRVWLNTTLESVSGEPGNFRISLRNGGMNTVSAGAIVTATGWSPYDAGKLSHLGYGSGGVKTLEEFEEFVQHEQVPGRVLFILCAGSRDESHLGYCSSYCCSAALKQALYVREINPDSEVYIVYRDIRTPGLQEEFYRMVQSDDAILLTKGMVEKVTEEGGAMLTTLRDSMLGEQVVIESDMVVLATGMVPNNTADLQLRYRQGKGLPELDYQFADSHFICFPYETRRTGIYAAGTVRAPMDMESCTEDAAGAMMKAIQAIECVGRGEAVHPRAGDQSYPELYMPRCTDCKRCTEECPFGSYDETEKGTPLPNPARCRRCGICLGSCPERVINFSDFSIHAVGAMIKSVVVPDEFEEKPRILVFVCENDAYPALDAAGIKRLRMSPFVRIIPVRCLGSINKVWISDALSHGYDGILQIGCKPGEDYQCHFIQGSQLTEERAENLQETLETMMLEPERIRTCFVEITDHIEIIRLINDYVEEVELLGPNPFKSL